MGALTRAAGTIIVIVFSFLELTYLSEHFSLLSFYSTIYLFVIFILYILLAFSALVSNIAKYVSPIIGLVIIAVRLSSTIKSMGLSTFITNIMNSFNITNSTAMFSTTYIIEVLVAAGFFFQLLGAIPTRSIR